MSGTITMIDDDNDYEVDSLFEEAVDNVRSDRNKAHKYIADLDNINFATFPDKFKMINKFVEASQRSNEQMIKITNMIYKNKRAGVEEDLESIGDDYYNNYGNDTEIVFDTESVSENSEKEEG